MFKVSSSIQEIMQSMQKSFDEQLNEDHAKLDRAANYLTEASLILKSANLLEEADELNILAKSLKKC